MQRALDERPDQAPTVLGAGVQVVCRLDFEARCACGETDCRLVHGAPVERRLGSWEPVLARPGADRNHVRVRSAPDLVHVIERGNAREGKVSTPARELLESPATRSGPGWQTDFDDEL